MTNTIPSTYQKPDGWYWETQTDADGPFSSEDDALNDYVDRHECEEE
jgi:hypothetical protein